MTNIFGVPLCCNVNLGLDTYPLCVLSAVPVTFTTPLYDITLPEGDNVMLKCVTSKPEKVQWFKNGKKITKPSKRIQLRDDGPEHTLVIDKSELDDGAEYTAKIGDESTTGKLKVEGKFSCYSAWLFSMRMRKIVFVSPIL